MVVFPVRFAIPKHTVAWLDGPNRIEAGARSRSVESSGKARRQREGQVGGAQISGHADAEQPAEVIVQEDAVRVELLAHSEKLVPFRVGALKVSVNNA